MLKTYLAPDNKNTHANWFRRVLGGWAVVPVSWQGFVVTFLYIGLVSLLVIQREPAIPGNPDSGTNFLVFGLPLLLLTTVFVFVAYKKGGRSKL